MCRTAADVDADACLGCVVFFNLGVTKDFISEMCAYLIFLVIIEIFGLLHSLHSDLHVVLWVYYSYLDGAC